MLVQPSLRQARRAPIGANPEFTTSAVRGLPGIQYRSVPPAPMRGAVQSATTSSPEDGEWFPPTVPDQVTSCCASQGLAEWTHQHSRAHCQAAPARRTETRGSEAWCADEGVQIPVAPAEAGGSKGLSPSAQPLMQDCREACSGFRGPVPQEGVVHLFQDANSSSYLSSLQPGARFRSVGPSQWPLRGRDLGAPCWGT